MPLWMKTGTINLVNGSKNVVGVGTQFLTATVPARAGQPIFINNVPWEIENVISNTSLTLALPYTGTTANGVAYTIMTTMEGSFNDLARRSAQVMGAYQGYMDVYEDLFTGAGDVTVTLPNGSVIVLPAWSALAPQRGSNANGSWVKYSDGTLICQLLSSTTNTALGTLGGNKSVVTTWEFPAPFIVQTSPVASFRVGSSNPIIEFSHSGRGGFGTASANILVVADANAPSGNYGVTFLYTAIGRWK